MQRILLIDSDNLAHRAFYATYRGPGAPILQHDGFPTNAIATWSSMLAALIAQADPSRVIFGLEGGASYRRGLFAGYKATRSEKPEALRRQLPVIEQIVRNSGVEFLHCEGEETDDVLMTFAHDNTGLAGVELLVGSEDKDFGQIVCRNVYQLKPAGGGQWTRIDSAGVKEALGVESSQVATYLAMVGDSSDNIPGIEQIGPGTAAKFLADHPTTEVLIERIAAKKKWPQERARSELEFNLKLTTFRHVANQSISRGTSIDSVLDQLQQLNCQTAFRIWRRMHERFVGCPTVATPRGASSTPMRTPLRSATAEKRLAEVQGELLLA